jgi:hypothetical protein
MRHAMFALLLVPVGVSQASTPLEVTYWSAPGISSDQTGRAHAPLLPPHP